MNDILAYYQGIADGTETVGEWIRLWYEQIIKGLETKAFYFNQKKATRAIRFIEGFCHHHEGALAPQLVKLEPWQKAFASVVFGIMDENGNRQFREVVLIVGRKNGKTLFAAAIAEYMAFLDGERGARIFFCAPKLKQARFCYDAFTQSVLQEPELRSLIRKRRTDIYIESTNTSIEPLAFNAEKSDGLNPHLVVCDEFSAWEGDRGIKQYEVMTSALGSRRQPMILAISTAHYVDGLYDELMRRCTAVLKGTSKEKRLAPFIYQIDNVEKWNDLNELKKSMPNLGVSFSIDNMLEQIAIAEGSLPKKAEFLTKYCNVKQNSSQAWLDAQTIRKAAQAVPELTSFRDCYAVMGIDLSRTTDLTAAVLCIEKDGVINVYARFYMPRDRIEEATQRDGVPYQLYAQRGWLFPSGDNFVDYNDVYLWARELIEKYRIYVLKIGYDRYSSQYLVQDLKNYGFHTDDVFQGENLTPVIRETEGLMKDGKIRIGDNDLLKIHLLNSALKVNSETERLKLIKIESRAHVDGMAALLDAMCVRQKYWNEIGGRLVNERRK